MKTIDVKSTKAFAFERPQKAASPGSESPRRRAGKPAITEVQDRAIKRDVQPVDDRTPAGR